MRDTDFIVIDEHDKYKMVKECIYGTVYSTGLKN